MARTVRPKPSSALPVRGERRQQHLIARVPLRQWFGATPEPPSDGNRGQNMLIRSPGQRARNPLRQRTGVSRNGGQGMHSYRHRLPSLADVLTPAANRKNAIWKAEQVVLVFQTTASKTVPGEERCAGRARWMRGTDQWRRAMGFGRGALLSLLGIPLPIILLLAIFWHH